MTDCPNHGSLVEIEVSKLPTQYREAAKLQAMMRVYLAQVEEAARVVCSIPDFFDIDTAVGDQLTILGRILGFPRCHCVCEPGPLIGIPYPEGTVTPYEIVGLCEGGSLAGCDGGSLNEFCINDDDVYRRFLKARRYQMLGLFDRDSLLAAARLTWGPTAWIVRADLCEVVLAPGRPIARSERPLQEIAARILPVAPGISLKYWTDLRPVAGIGQGWAGLCVPPNVKVVGIDCGGSHGVEIAGLCEPGSTWANCLPPNTGAGVMLCPESPSNC